MNRKQDSKRRQPATSDEAEPRKLKLEESEVRRIARRFFSPGDQEDITDLLLLSTR